MCPIIRAAENTEGGDCDVEPVITHKFNCLLEGKFCIDGQQPNLCSRSHVGDHFSHGGTVRTIVQCGATKFARPFAVSHIWNFSGGVACEASVYDSDLSTLT